MAIGKVGVENMYFVYILQSLKTGRYYIGSTNNVERRISEHNGGKTKSLRSHRPLELKFCKSFDIKQKAIDMEIKIKKLKSREIITRIVSDGELKMGL
jgi:putative endonuclease